MAGFGYQILGFGSGGAAAPYNVQYLVVAGGGSGGTFSYGGAGGGAGGFRNVASKNFEVLQWAAELQEIPLLTAKELKDKTLFLIQLPQQEEAVVLI